jgi:hypothetical protein
LTAASKAASRLPTSVDWLVLRATSEMNPQELFDECCADIETAYARLGHKFGWRFLTCRRSRFIANPKVALITLQPAGRRDYFPELPRQCQELGSAYLVESWDGRPRGRDPLQRQVRLFFAALARRIGAPSGDQLLSDSLSSHFVPFRAPNFADMPNRTATLAFSTALWAKILRVIQPKVIVVLQKESFEIFSALLARALGERGSLTTMPTGWGNYVARIRDFSAGPMVCWFPHWSRFPVFGRPQSELYVSEIVLTLSKKLL